MITFSGIDCSGKSTQISIIKEKLIDKKIKIKVIWSRGGYTPVLEFIKNVFRRDKKMSESEKENYRSEIHKNRLKRKILLWISIFDLVFYYGIYFRVLELFRYKILADRYIWDTFIDFQIKYGDIKFEKWFIWRFLLITHLKPKHSIILTIPAEESLRRSDLKFEPFPENYEQRVIRINHYVKEINNKKWKNVIDATKSIDRVSSEIMEIIYENN